jgi:predicted oxidoreductase
MRQHAGMLTPVNLGPQGPWVSPIVYGTWRLLADPELATPQAVARRLGLCAELGITTIDTAEIYGGYDVEERLGQALALSPALKQKLQIVTKFGIYVPNHRHPERKVAFYNASAERIVKSTEKSLRLLGVESLDVLLVHRPDWFTAAEDTARGLEQVMASGKVKAVGVSNYTVSQFDLLQSCMSKPLVTNQVEVNLLAMGALYDGTLDQCQQRKIRPMAWSPLGGGRLLSGDDPAGVRVRAACAAMSEKYGGASVSTLLYAWVMAHPSRCLPVLGTNKEDRIKEAVSSAGIKLEQQDWYALWEAAKGHKIP